MGMTALSIAATGMSAQQTNLDVIANNIANINTTGYKRSKAEFTDLLYETVRSQGVSQQAGLGLVPEGAKLGLGVRLAAIRDIHLQGALQNTGNPFDLAINGRGWFQITGPDGETLYTRDGAFNLNENRQLVTLNGYLIEPEITIPENATQVTINDSGMVYAYVDGQAAPTEVGQIALANFPNEAGLDPLGDNLFRETEASGAAVSGVPGSPNYGKLLQTYLEGSNVDAVHEITAMIAAQRAYEMNSKVIQAADEMSSTVTKGIR
ncbi:MAG: flagellar basal-body rod protein FlgG [Alphaproteobacteria bacterium]|nr:MAG: flagellar basal-body rod protein FlgG [Alphaproteobacteria bacterium]